MVNTFSGTRNDYRRSNDGSATGKVTVGLASYGTSHRLGVLSGFNGLRVHISVDTDK